MNLRNALSLQLLLFCCIHFFLSQRGALSVKIQGQFVCGYVLGNNHSAAVDQVIFKTAFQIVRFEYFRIFPFHFQDDGPLCLSRLDVLPHQKPSGNGRTKWKSTSRGHLFSTA